MWNNNAFRKLILYWLPVLLWMGLIFYSSHQPYQQQDLRPWLSNVVAEDLVKERFSAVRINYAGNEISIKEKGVAGFIEFFIRKGAHLGAYAILSILLLRALWKTTPLRMWPIVGVTLVVSFLYACSDELHQKFTGNRTPLFSDVMLDTVGAVIGVLFSLIFISVVSKQNR